MQIINRDQLPWDDIAHELLGADHGLDITILFVDAAPPGEGPALHRHPYPEVFVVLEGEASFTVGGQEATAHAGDILIGPAGQPHAFVNSGTAPLRQIDIHLSPSPSTEWLE
jgi:mannose-6-phosphate isomerase-like protein (cupin superfamily)